MFKASGLSMMRARIQSFRVTNYTRINTILFRNEVNTIQGSAQIRFFASSKPSQSNQSTESEQEETKPLKKRGRPKTGKQSQASTDLNSSLESPTKVKKSKKESGKKKKEAQEDSNKEYQMYTLKFNSPILPFSKFPLTQNKYIQDFLKKYDEDKDKIQKVIGVHFVNNSNLNAQDTVGIEIEIIKKNNITIVESNSNKRFKIKSYDELSNFCTAKEYSDVLELKKPVTKEEDQKLKDLLMSELFELKNLWFMYNKKINQLLVILPQEILNRYDMVTKTLQPPVFDISKYPADNSFLDTFNEIVYKMAQYYFSIFQAIFSKDNESVRPQIQEFLNIDDPIHRSRKIIVYYDEMHSIIDKKLYYVQKMAEEFKERSKTSLLEHAYQRVLEDNKTSEKKKFQKKLEEIKSMPESVRKVLQEEINQLDQKNDMDNARKIQYLNHIFRLPWDQRVEPYWDVQYSKEVVEKSHYGMKDTKERILEFIAKNKRINSQKGMVLLLTGPPGVGKTTIAKSIGDCLKRPTTVISMGGQNDPIHVKGSKRTYVDSQPGIFIKELQRLECKNPVIVIDEIDKVGYNSLKGDVSSTLLELLNPEQSNQFRDNYLDIEFDFSECIFICTSNSTAHMLQPLLDRIEIIQIPAYLPSEKIAIAQNYLIPRFEDEYAFDASHSDNEKIDITDAALIKIINHYCSHEAGVRNLRKCLDRIFRKVVAKLENKKIEDSETSSNIEATEDSNHIQEEQIQDTANSAIPAGNISSPTVYKSETPLKVVKEYQINTKNIEYFLDIPPTDDNYYQNINKQLPVGCSNGLAYIDDGYGSVLKIQFVKKAFGRHRRAHKEEKEESKDDSAQIGGDLTHTGRLGEVMKESVEVVKIAVFNFLTKQKIAKNFDKDSYHLHVPMGAIPKDGPSAGISLFSALVSIATEKPLIENIAMTGEITTLGEVISIGGVREKLTACKNYNISRVILPLSNKKHVKKLPEEFKRGFTIFYVSNIDQVYEVCFNSEQDMMESKFGRLKDLGVEVEQFEEDNSSQVMIDNENILKRNFLEELM